MADKIRFYTNGSYLEQCWFHCPGCECDHAFTVKNDHEPLWTWNGDKEKPTFTPSLMCNRDEPTRRCHSVVTDGMIAFQGDCYHKLNGQTVDLPDWKGW